MSVFYDFGHIKPEVIVLTFLFTGLILLIAALLISANFFCDIAVARQNKTYLNFNEEKADDLVKEEQRYRDYLHGQSNQKIELNSYKNKLIRGYYYHNGSNVVVICVHGYCGSHKSMGNFVMMYKDVFGFDVLAPDLRGCGSSEGNYIGFGSHDRLDILKWIDYVISKRGEKTKIILHGISMGGATVLLTGGEKLPENVKLIVSDCAYSSTYEILSYQMKKQFGLPPRFLIRLMDLMCKLRYGYSFREGEVKKAVGRIVPPVLYIHGGLDDFVPYRMVYELYENTKTDKGLYVVEKASHADSFFVEEEGYKKRIKNFIEKFVV